MQDTLKKQEQDLHSKIEEIRQDISAAVEKADNPNTQVLESKIAALMAEIAMLKLIIAKMVAPIASTLDIENATIAMALSEVWQKYKNEADIDKLVEVLGSLDNRGRDLRVHVSRQLWQIFQWPR